MHSFVYNVMILVLFLIVMSIPAAFLFRGIENWGKGKSFLGGPKGVRQKKMVINPKSALHEPGICQCNDALAFHQGSGGCAVPGCPCQQFIPSTLDPEELLNLTNANVTRIAIENVNQRLSLEAKQTQLDEAERQRRRAHELEMRRVMENGMGPDVVRNA